MAGAKRFEDLLMWRKARQLANLIYDLTGQESFRDASLRNQMRRAAVSIMSNVAEGFGRGSNEEFARSLFISKGSAAELLSQLYLSLDRKYITPAQFAQAEKLCQETTGMIQAFIRSMKSAGRPAFRHRRKVVPWTDQVQQVMKEIAEEAKE